MENLETQDGRLYCIFGESKIEKTDDGVIINCKGDVNLKLSKNQLLILAGHSDSGVITKEDIISSDVSEELNKISERMDEIIKKSKKIKRTGKVLGNNQQLTKREQITAMMAQGELSRACPSNPDKFISGVIEHADKLIEKLNNTK